MELPAGTRLGPYEILSPLGAGGMGEVYRARDSRLAREVAIKVLPAALAADADRLKRFEKEARSASALNHPNIVTIFDIGSQEGVAYIAMERVEGTTLRELLVGGPMPIKKLFQVASQIAEGLAKAHQAGIVHRDLKPENVMVTKDGLVKILDFGLAKLTSTMSGSDEGSNLPTMTETTRGVVVGTVGYMSPEQAGGASLDFRSDQFALGSILYEMATGRRAFQKKTAVETLTAILNEEPEGIGAINPRVPAPLRWIVERCLSKDPRGRYASTEDLARELETVRDHLSESTSTSVSLEAGRARRRVGSRLAVFALAVLGSLAAGLFLARLLWTATGSFSPVIRQLTFGRGPFSARFAPDGQTVFYGAGIPPQIYAVRPESSESSPLALPNANVLSISSTGWMALRLVGENHTLAQVPLAGGAPREILEHVSDASWSPDGRLAVAHFVGSRCRLEFPIGKTLYESHGRIDGVSVSPTGDRIAFLDHPLSGDDAGSVAVVDLNGKAKTLAIGWYSAQGLAWSPQPTELWFAAADAASDSSVRSLRAVTLEGRQRVLYRAPTALTLHDVSRGGRALVSTGTVRFKMMGIGPGNEQARDLSWLDWSQVSDLSADGSTLLFSVYGQSSKLTHGYGVAAYLRKTDGSPAVRLADGAASALSPDGKFVLCMQGPNLERLVVVPTGPGQQRTVPLGQVHPWGAAFLDGKQILIVGREPGRPERCYVSDGQSIPRPITPEAVGVDVISPDGRAIIARGVDGTFSVFPVAGGPSAPVPALRAGDAPLQWSEDARTIYVRAGRGLPVRIYRVNLASGRRELWKELVPAESEGVEGISSIAITRDGRTLVYDYRRSLFDLYVIDGLR